MKRSDQCSSGLVAFETSILIGGDDHDFFFPMDAHMLRPDVSGAANDLAEPRFGVLQPPAAGMRRTRRASF